MASEVRNLSRRSAQAAREIKALIVRSTETVSEGSHLVVDGGKVMGTSSRRLRPGRCQGNTPATQLYVAEQFRRRRFVSRANARSHLRKNREPEMHVR